MHLESAYDHQLCVAFAPLNLHFVKCETVHTESSYEVTDEAIRILLEDAGFDVERTWMKGLGWYAIAVARFGKERIQYQTDL